MHKKKSMLAQKTISTPLLFLSLFCVLINANNDTRQLAIMGGTIALQYIKHARRVACLKIRISIDVGPSLLLRVLQKYSHSLRSFIILVDIDQKTWNRLQSYVMEWNPIVEEAKTRDQIDHGI